MWATTPPPGGTFADVNFFDGGGLHFPTSGPFTANQNAPNSSNMGGPVFTLPPGYTANSPSLNIVDNVWQGSGGPVATRESTWGKIKSLYMK